MNPRSVSLRSVTSGFGDEFVRMTAGKCVEKLVPLARESALERRQDPAQRRRVRISHQPLDRAILPSQARRRDLAAEFMPQLPRARDDVRMFGIEIRHPIL